MAKDKSKKDGAPSEYDPKVEARVDALMSGESKIKPEAEADVKPKISTATSAPLLPGEELPDFNSKKPAAAANSAEPPDSEDKPLKGLVNNIADKVVKPPKELKASAEIEDKKTDEAVKDIEASETDRILAIEDAKAEMLAKGEAEVDEGGAISKFFRALRRFFGSKAFKIVFLILLILGLAAAFIYPDSRYWLLNKAGVRASASFKIVDEQTSQPLKDVTVTIGQVSAISTEDGNVTLNEILLGKQQMSITKPAFADIHRSVVIGWGSNPGGQVGMTATGTRYTFQLNAFLSGKPVTNAAAKSGEASAKANKDGEIVLVVADKNKETVEAEISADGYRTEKITLKVGDEEAKKIVLVPSKKHAFVSKRSGSYDLYKVDIDGKNEEKILDGTGNEREEELSILAHPAKDIAAFVSIRGDERTKDGRPIASLNLVDLSDNSVEKIIDSPYIQLLEFIDNKLVYIRTQPKAGEKDKRRDRLVAFDLESLAEQELASTNYFNSVLVANGVIYYSPSEYQVNGKVGFYSINPDGSGKKTILAKEAWNLFRTAFDKITVAIADEWYVYDINTGQNEKLKGSPASQKSRVYSLSPDKKKAAWIDERDGKGVLLIYEVATGKEKVLQRQNGLVNPLAWIGNSYLVYRVTSGETADYVISINGGKPRKIVDVTDTVGLDRFYIY